MHFGFLTPQLFDYLIYANLAFGALLIIVRFTLDMRRQKPNREEMYSESSQSNLDDTNPSLAQNTEPNQNRSKQ
jgi:hypothetical protein